MLSDKQTDQNFQNLNFRAHHFLIHTANSLEKVIPSITAYYHHDNNGKSCCSYLIPQIIIHRYNSTRKWHPPKPLLFPPPTTLKPKKLLGKNQRTHKKKTSTFKRTKFVFYSAPSWEHARMRENEFKSDQRQCVLERHEPWGRKLFFLIFCSVRVMNVTHTTSLNFYL